MSAKDELTLHIAKDIAFAAGLAWDRWGERTQRDFLDQAEVAQRGFINWVVNNAPDVVQPLRDAGVLIWRDTDGFGRKP